VGVTVSTSESIAGAGTRSSYRTLVVAVTLHTPRDVVAVSLCYGVVAAVV
jgi:hypothetical protein